MDSVHYILQNAGNCTNEEIIASLRQAAKVMSKKQMTEYWLSDDGQDELVRRIEERSKKPETLAMLDYNADTKAMLSSASTSDVEEWIEVELTADTGACDTVMPRSMAQHIPIQPSAQSLSSMMYEVADGNEIPNLGERRCVMWTEGSHDARKINMQVADVHKALLSLSRCADMGFESRFGRRAGALIDEESGEVIPLARKGNLYILKCWLKAAPFGRPDVR